MTLLTSTSIYIWNLQIQQPHPLHNNQFALVLHGCNVVQRETKKKYFNKMLWKVWKKLFTTFVFQVVNILPHRYTFRAAYFHKMKIKIIYYDIIRREWTSREKKFQGRHMFKLLHKIPSWFMLAKMIEEDVLIKLQHYRNDSNIQTQNRIFKWCSFHISIINHYYYRKSYCNKRALNESYKVYMTRQHKILNKY